jgi:hypothetical protein
MGPLQLKILKTLALALTMNRPMSATEIAQALKVTPGSVSGAISGMRFYSERHWVKPADKSCSRLERRYVITADGVIALMDHPVTIRNVTWDVKPYWRKSFARNDSRYLN